MNQSNQEMFRQLGISEEVYKMGERVCESLKERFEKIDQTAEYNQLKIVKAMQDNKVGEACLLGTTGYGYNDLGRDTLEAVYSSVFHTEDALVRPQITCGTHALALALMSNLRPGDELLSPVGKPYDTLEEVIGIRPSKGSLAEYGISPGHAVGFGGEVQAFVIDEVDEKLCRGRMRVSRACHGDGVLEVGQAVVGLVLDRRARALDLQILGEAAALDHEARNHAMEHGAVVETVFGVLEKILDRLRRLSGIEFDRDIPLARVQDGFGRGHRGWRGCRGFRRRCGCRLGRRLGGGRFHGGLAESKRLTTAPLLAEFDRSADELAARSASCFGTDDVREGMLAFLQKRQPSWAQ